MDAVQLHARNARPVQNSRDALTVNPFKAAPGTLTGDADVPGHELVIAEAQQFALRLLA